MQTTDSVLDASKNEQVVSSDKNKKAPEGDPKHSTASDDVESPSKNADDQEGPPRKVPFSTLDSIATVPAILQNSRYVLKGTPSLIEIHGSGGGLNIIAGYAQVHSVKRTGKGQDNIVCARPHLKVRDNRVLVHGSVPATFLLVVAEDMSPDI